MKISPLNVTLWQFLLLTSDIMSVIFSEKVTGEAYLEQPQIDFVRIGDQPPPASRNQCSRGGSHRAAVPDAGDRANQTVRRCDSARRVVPAPVLHDPAELHPRIRGADRHEGRSAAFGIPGLQPAGQSRIVVRRLGL